MLGLSTKLWKCTGISVHLIAEPGCFPMKRSPTYLVRSVVLKYCSSVLNSCWLFIAVCVEICFKQYIHQARSESTAITRMCNIKNWTIQKIISNKHRFRCWVKKLFTQQLNICTYLQEIFAKHLPFWHPTLGPEGSDLVRSLRSPSDSVLSSTSMNVFLGSRYISSLNWCS